MIKTRDDLKEYLYADMLNLGKNGRPRIFGDEIWKFEILLRKYEFHLNNNHKVRSVFLRYKVHKYYIKYNIIVPPNVFDKGLSIAHLGCIFINNNARIGKNCRIHEMVTIGATGGSPKSALIGDNVFIGTGAKIIGELSIANNVAIGANAVVCKSILEEGTTWAGVPAKKISNKDSKAFIPALNKYK